VFVRADLRLKVEASQSAHASADAKERSLARLAADVWILGLGPLMCRFETCVAAEGSFRKLGENEKDGEKLISSSLRVYRKEKSVVCRLGIDPALSMQGLRGALLTPRFRPAPASEAQLALTSKPNLAIDSGRSQ